MIRSFTIAATLMFLSLILVPMQTSAEDFDLIIRGGRIVDGSGNASFTGDVGVKDGRVSEVGDLSGQSTKDELDAAGLVVAPGFINVLSWAPESLIHDGRSLSDIKQGVTLEVFGEGWSMGPLNEAMKKESLDYQADIYYDIDWTTLGEYLEYLEKRGTSANVASFVGATTIRIHELGFEDRDPNPEELDRMRALVRTAMEEGALGVGSSMIYPPATFAETDELVALCEVAGEYGGMYISHMRSEGNQLLEAVDELIEISRRANCPAEIYHLKAAGKDNWGKLDQAIAKVEAARKEGLEITADMYTYVAGATGLSASMPPWVQEGGHEAFMERLRDSQVREQVKQEILTPSNEWENLYLAAGGPENLLLIGFKSPDLKPLTGKTLAEVAEARGVSPVDAMIDLILEDDSRIETAYFIMSEENVAKKIALPWVSFCSDAESLAPEGVFLKSNPHPRAYGSFSRLLGKYVREEGVISLEEAVRRLSSFPAETLSLEGRGRIEPGYYADLVVFDPDTIQDNATFAEPHQLAGGVQHVYVNGEQVLRDGDHTGATPGVFVRGPGYKGKR